MSPRPLREDHEDVEEALAHVDEREIADLTRGEEDGIREFGAAYQPQARVEDVLRRLGGSVYVELITQPLRSPRTSARNSTIAADWMRYLLDHTPIGRMAAPSESPVP